MIKAKMLKDYFDMGKIQIAKGQEIHIAPEQATDTGPYCKAHFEIKKGGFFHPASRQVFKKDIQAINESTAPAFKPKRGRQRKGAL